MAKLTEQEIKTALTELKEWQLAGIAIQRIYTFPDFKQAIVFVNKMAGAAEEANHHPDIDIRYNKVTVSLTSHDSGGITARDVKMAKRINSL